MNRIIPIASGKGGVGKSVFAVNYAISLAKSGKTVILVDLDLGRLNAAKLSSLSILEAIKNSNVNYPAGTIHGQKRFT